MGRFLGLECDGTDGCGNDHEGRDVRDVNMFGVVVVAIVSEIRQAVVRYRQRTSCGIQFLGSLELEVGS